jgi:hypothetical protein
VVNIDSKRIAAITAVVLSFLVSLTTILGIPVALYGYLMTQQQSRVDRTFQFYKDFRDGNLDADVKFLVETANAKAKEMQDLVDKNDQAGILGLQTSLARDPKVDDALAHVIVFFDAVGPCVAHALCDADATIALLQFQAKQLVKGYGAYVYNQRQSGAPFGDGVFTVNGLETSSRIWSLFPWPTHNAN